MSTTTVVGAATPHCIVAADFELVINHLSFTTSNAKSVDDSTELSV